MKESPASEPSLTVGLLHRLVPRMTQLHRSFTCLVITAGHRPCASTGQ